MTIYDTFLLNAVFLIALLIWANVNHEEPDEVHPDMLDLIALTFFALVFQACIVVGVWTFGVFFGK